MSHIFLSYNRKDQEYVRKLVQYIKETVHLEVWMDDSIDFGSKWRSEIEKNIDNCAGFIVVMTTHSRASEWVERELLRAQRLGKPIFPILLDGDVWLELENTQVHDIRTSAENQTEWRLPSIDFYQDIIAQAPTAWKGILTDKEREEIRIQRARRHRPLYERIDNRPKDPTIFTTITEAIDRVQNYPNNYLALALLALAYAEEGSRAESIVFLRKAIMLEPRIKFRQWMRSHHGWANRENALLEQILADPHFRSPIDPLSFQFPPYPFDQYYYDY